MDHNYYFDVASSRWEYEQCCGIVNNNNNLSVQVTPEKLALSRGDLIYTYKKVESTPEPVITGCVFTDKLDWYLGAIKYLSVIREDRRKGLGCKLVEMALGQLRAKNTKVVQSTIRETNIGSKTLFSKFKFTKVNEFSTENTIGIYQKVF